MDQRERTRVMQGALCEAGRPDLAAHVHYNEKFRRPATARALRDELPESDLRLIHRASQLTVPSGKGYCYECWSAQTTDTCDHV